MSERYWQSLDMSVSKIVLEEGDLTGNCPTFGAEIVLHLEEFDIEQLNFESVFFAKEDIIANKNISVKMGFAFDEIDLAIEQAVSSMYPKEKSRFDVSATSGCM